MPRQRHEQALWLVPVAHRWAKRPRVRLVNVADASCKMEQVDPPNLRTLGSVCVRACTHESARGALGGRALGGWTCAYGEREAAAAQTLHPAATVVEV